MAYIPVKELLNNCDSIYKLVALASKRAIELSNGAKKLIDSNLENPQLVAIEEIKEGKIKYKKKKKSE
jgi:DNA-directed RNA polymerase subunit omega